MELEIQLSQPDFKGMPDGWACGTINPTWKGMGCGRPFNGEMYLIRAQDVRVVRKIGAQWVCKSCVQRLGLVW